MNLIKMFPGKLLEWHDGDTCHIEVELWDDLKRIIIVRLSNASAPELTGPNPDEVKRGYAAKAMSIQLAPPNSGIQLRTDCSREKYGRTLGEIITAEGKNVGEELVKANLAGTHHTRGLDNE